MQLLYKSYLERRDFASKIGLSERRKNLCEDLGKLLIDLATDELFLLKGEESHARRNYNRKFAQSNTSKESLFALAWDVDGFKQLLKVKQEFVQNVTSILRDFLL